MKKRDLRFHEPPAGSGTRVIIPCADAGSRNGLEPASKPTLIEPVVAIPRPSRSRQTILCSDTRHDLTNVCPHSEQQTREWNTATEGPTPFVLFTPRSSVGCVLPKGVWSFKLIVWLPAVPPVVRQDVIWMAVSEEGE